VAAKKEVGFIITARDLTRGAFRSVGRSLRGLRRGLLSLKGLFVGVLGGGLITRALSGTLNNLNDIADAAAGLGVGTKFLQAFGRAADEVGSNFNTAVTVIQRLQTRIGRALEGDTRLAKAFAEFGLSPQDLQVKETEEVLDIILSKIRDMSAAQRQAALEPLVDVEGIRLLPRIAAEFGSIAGIFAAIGDEQLISDDILNRAERLKDLFGNIYQTIRAAFIEFMVPQLEKAVGLAVKLLDALKEANEIRKEINEFGEGVGETAFRTSRSLGFQNQGTISRAQEESIIRGGGTQRDILAAQNAAALTYSRLLKKPLEEIAVNTRTRGSVFGE
jgi:hypothetical protein